MRADPSGAEQIPAPTTPCRPRPSPRARSRWNDISTAFASSLRWRPKPGGEEARALARRLIAPLDSAIRLMLLDVLAVAAAEITRGLAPGSVELRLHGTDPGFVVEAPSTGDGAGDVSGTGEGWAAVGRCPRRLGLARGEFPGSTCACPIRSRAGSSMRPIGRVRRSTAGWCAPRRLLRSATRPACAVSTAPHGVVRATPAGGVSNACVPDARAHFRGDRARRERCSYLGW